jgi:hypothetical protein
VNFSPDCRYSRINFLATFSTFAAERLKSGEILAQRKHSNGDVHNQVGVF